MSNGIRNLSRVIGDSCGSVKEKDRGNAERNNTPLEMRANQGLKKKLFTPKESHYEGDKSFKDLAETPLFMSRNIITHSSANSIEMPKQIHS